MTASKIQDKAIGAGSYASIFPISAHTAIAVRIPVYSQTDTVGSLIDRVVEAVSSERPLTEDQLHDCATYLDLKSKVEELKALEQQYENLIQARISSPVSQPKAVQNPAVPSEATSKVHTSGSGEPSDIGSKQREILFDEQSIENQALQFSQISKTELQEHLDWMSGEGRPVDEIVKEFDTIDNTVPDQEPITDNDLPRPGLLARANRVIWNALSYVYSAKK